MTSFRTGLLVSCVVVISMAILVGGCEDNKIPLNAMPKCSTPEFSPSPGSYTSRQSVGILCATEGAIVRYSTDGSVPVVMSSEFTIPIQISDDVTIKARAWKQGYNQSSIATASYIIALDVVSTPAFDPPPGTYVGGQNVEIRCATEGATIRYTTDGSEPTEVSVGYTEPIGIVENTTIKARAWKGNMDPSDTAVGSYTIESIVEVSTPTFSP